jgi:DNA-binding transcriptional LysR family regulator
MENASRAGALEIVLEAFEPTPRPVNIVYPEQRLLPVKIRAFLDWATPRLKVRLTQRFPAIRWPRCAKSAVDKDRAKRV